MAKSLLDSFAELSDERKHALSDLDSPRKLAFAALQIGEEQCGIDRLSAEHIVACLEQAGFAVKRLSISRALANARGCVSTAQGEEGDTVYKLMTKGREELQKALGQEQISVVRVESGQPRTARYKLGEMLSALRGIVRICDPYYGVRTLDSLDHIPKSCQVRFLTARTSEAGRKLTYALRDFKKERPSVEFRIDAKPNELHDRYLLTQTQIFLLGHGLKDIGGKEAFMIGLDKNLVPDLLRETTRAFDARWSKAQAL